MLKQIMAKFNVRQPGLDATSWGEIYCGGEVPEDSAVEEDYMRQITGRTMSAAAAAPRKDRLTPRLPYYRREQFMADIAALVVLFPNEVKTQTKMQGRRLYMVLASQCTASKVGGDRDVTTELGGTL